MLEQKPNSRASQELGDIKPEQGSGLEDEGQRKCRSTPPRSKLGALGHDAKSSPDLSEGSTRSGWCGVSEATLSRRGTRSCLDRVRDTGAEFSTGRAMRARPRARTPIIPHLRKDGWRTNVPVSNATSGWLLNPRMCAPVCLPGHGPAARSSCRGVVASSPEAS